MGTERGRGLKEEGVLKVSDGLKGAWGLKVSGRMKRAGGLKGVGGLKRGNKRDRGDRWGERGRGYNLQAN